VGGFRKAFGGPACFALVFWVFSFLDSNLSGFLGPSFSNPHFFGFVCHSGVVLRSFIFGLLTHFFGIDAVCYGLFFPHYCY